MLDFSMSLFLTQFYFLTNMEFHANHMTNKAVTELNADLEKIKQWVYQWRMQFNLDLNKLASEVIFCYKLI